MHHDGEVLEHRIEILNVGLELVELLLSVLDRLQVLFLYLTLLAEPLLLAEPHRDVIVEIVKSAALFLGLGFLKHLES